MTHDNQVRTICIEDLHVKGMMRNKRLAGHLADVGMGKFFEVLKYKCEWYGIHLIEIGRFEPSSKRCHVCGWKKEDMKLSDREWTCECCKTKHDRDVNAARNIKAFGLEKIGQGLSESTSVESTLSGSQGANFVGSRGSVKQKKR